MRLSLIAILISMSVAFFTVSGCGEDGPADVDGQILPINVSMIILSPKSPAPGDTVQVTAVVTSDTLNFEFPRYSWSASGGTFLESDQLSVRWVAPQTSDIYTISVTVENSVSTSSRSVDVFVNSIEEIVSYQAGELHTTISGDSIYFLTSNRTPSHSGFRGFLINLYQRGGGVTPVTTDIDFRGLGYVFSTDRTFSAHTVETRPGGATIENPINIILDDLQTGVQEQITFDQMTPFDIRHTQYTEIVFSPDNNLIGYQVFRPFPAPGQVDTFDVAFYNRTLASEINATGSHGKFRKNFYPTFSTDGNWLLFVSNRTGQILWELYGLPVSGGTVPLDSASTVRITNTGGSISANLIPTKPLQTWNPNAIFSVLAIVDANGQLHIVDPDGPSDITVAVPDAPGELVWAPNGESLAIAATRRLYVLDFSLGQVGNVNLVKEAASGDKITDIAWSEDSDYLIYRVTRAVSCWFEFADIAGNIGLEAPVIVAPAVPIGDIEDYLGIMFTKPQWGAGGEVFLLHFDRSSPRMIKLDLTGALP